MIIGAIHHILRSRMNSHNSLKKDILLIEKPFHQIMSWVMVTGNFLVVFSLLFVKIIHGRAQRVGHNVMITWPHEEYYGPR